MSRTFTKGKIAGLTFVFLWFFIGGIAHFVKTDLEVSIVPPYIPWPRAAVLFSGACELLGAAGILYGPTRRAAGIGLLALTIAVTPANIFMAQHANQFQIPEWILIARLPVQLGLLMLIAWSTSVRTRNAMASALFIACGLLAYQARPAEASTAPAWAYPINPPAGADEHSQPSPSELRHVPDSAVALSDKQIADLFFAADWHPEEHAKPPEVVLRGRPPAVFACGSCHRITGSGGPENASLAGLPEAYILSQLDDYRSGARLSTLPKRLPQAFMVALAKSLSPEDERAAAHYFSSLKPVAHIRVVESAQAPRTHVLVWRLAADADGIQEPLGQRIVELPDRPADFESRDSRASFTAYVPRGSIDAGNARVRTQIGPGAPACVSCHGANLWGVGVAPPLAGRSPSYLVRQLVDMQTGARNGPGAQLMKAVVAPLTTDDMIAIAAYLSSLPPS